MKKILYTLLALLITGTWAQAQKARTIPAGYISSNTTWYNDTIYTLDGYVYVKNATLTIQPGTLIKGGNPSKKSTLIITMSGKLNAEGTQAQPIVFTSSSAPGSRNPGDWGGIVLLGQATINRPTDCSICPGSTVAAGMTGIQNNIEGDLDNASGDGLYGGVDNNHSSGTLSYIRLEYGGVVITPGNEINGLTMGGVGKGTTIHHIQVTQANDDGFEWFGGNVDAKYLISNRNIDDDLDTDFGYTGRIQYAIVLRDSNWYDIGAGPTTNGFESDNDGTGTEANPFTNPTFSNITLVGPLSTGKALDFSNSFQNGARIRRNASTSIFNSIIMGWPTGLFVDGTRTGNKFQTDSMMFKNNIMAGNLNNINPSSDQASTVRTKIMQNGNDTIVSANGLLVNPFNYNTPNFLPASGSKALSGASFTGATRISDAFFTPTTFRGALGGNTDSNWTDCWCRFEPQNENYNTAPISYPAPAAAFTASAPVGRTVVFTNSSTNATKYFWDFGVATSAEDTSVEQNPTFVFPSNGIFTVTLTIRGTCGVSVLTKTVVINDLSTKPVANFKFTQNTSTGSLEFTFENQTDEKLQATTYSWDFGVAASSDDTSSVKSPVFTFPANGIYTVKLIAMSAGGTDSVTKTVNAIRVGVNEIKQAVNNVKLYPNPTTGSVTVDFDLDRNSNISLNVFDLTGRVVKEICQDKAFGAGKNTMSFNADELKDGIYFVQLQSPSGNKTTRLVIAK